MRQIGHIFWKDVRFLWMDLTALLAIVAFFGVSQVEALSKQSHAFNWIGAQRQFLPILLTLSWVILIIRLVQAERLSGRNQFWTTKPYSWWSLLTAKILFVLTFVYAPLLLMQMVLLRYVQLPVIGNAENMLVNAFLLSVYVVLPVLCVASLTRSFAMAMLSLLGGCASLLVGVVWLLGDVGSLSRRRAVIQLAIVAMMLCIALMAQYWRRRTVMSLGICAAGLLIALGLQVAWGQKQHSDDSHTLMLTDAPVSIELDRDPKEQSDGTNGQDSPQVQITLPMTVSHVEEGMSYSIDGHYVAFSPQDGVGFTGWGSGGTSSWNERLERLEPSHGAMNIFHVQEIVPAAQFLRMANTPVNVRVEMSLTEMHSHVVSRVEASTKMYMVPGIGNCRLTQSFGMTCVTAFGGSRQMASVRVGAHSGECTPLTSTVWMNGYGESMDFVVAGAEQGLPALSLSPVDITGLRIRPPLAASLCEGTPLEFIVDQPVRKIRIAMPTATVNVRQYAQKHFGNQ